MNDPAFMVTYGETDSEGWTEVLYKTGKIVETDPPREGDEFWSEDTSEVIGVMRVVEGTEDGPTQWYDVRVEDRDGGWIHQRRFVGMEQAMFALVLRRFSETESMKALGW